MTHVNGNLLRLRNVSNILHYSTGKVNVNGVDLFYERAGCGNRTVLLMPGSLGSTSTDFAPQMKGLDREKFTLVSFDPRGYGRSIPPERDFPIDYLNRDAEDAAMLMKTLGFRRYSVLGWSDGGNSAIILTAKYPSAVENLVVWGANAYIAEEDVKILKSMRDISTWSPKARESMAVMYSMEYLQKTWIGLGDALIRIYEEHDGDIYKSLLKDIKASTLIIHGLKDSIVPLFHPKFIHDNIKGSKLDFWPEGKHNLHLRYPEQFNLQVEKFLLKSN